MTNIDLLEYSIKNPEEYVDSAYIKSGDLIISTDTANLTRVQCDVRKMRECITALKVINDAENNAQVKKSIILKIKDLLDNDENMNLSEFVSYWAVNDVSYSLYKSMEEDDKLVFLEKMIQYYNEYRDDLYVQYGYSDVSLQTKLDANQHKGSGELGLRKVANILEENGFQHINTDFNDFINPNLDFVYIFSDKDGKKIVPDIISNFKIKFQWKTNHEDKNPDFILRIKNKILILEHKHMKELGGGQDKQISEIIDFIKYSDVDVSYVSFLDGVLFNKIFKLVSNTRSNKIKRQKEAIYSALELNSDNYFLNTAGFLKFIEAIKA